jgi:hypothetical protein
MMWWKRWHIALRCNEIEAHRGLGWGRGGVLLASLFGKALLHLYRCV